MHLVGNWKSTLPMKELKELNTILSGKMRLVGGCVRDLLLNQPINDIDVATPMLPDDVIEKLKLANIRYKTMGLAHGTVTAFFGKHVFEITTLRYDSRCYGRKADVSFTRNWKEDALRRDFSINAIYSDLDGILYDYVGGIRDIKELIVKFIGIPEKRIHEDFLRILRYFRFLSYYGSKNLDAESLNACKELGSSLANISGERIAQEMFKMMGKPYFYEAFIKFPKSVLDAVNLPKISAKQISTMQFIEREEIPNLCALLLVGKVIASDIDRLCKNWKLSKNYSYTIKKVTSMGLSFHSPEDIHKKYIYQFGVAIYTHLINTLNVVYPEHHQYKKCMDLARTFTPPKFPIDGNYLKSIGYQGKRLGLALKHLEAIWLREGFKYTKPINHYLKDIPKK